MKNKIILRSYLHITSRKRNDQGKLITNPLTRDLKIKEDDFLIVSISLGISPEGGKYVDVENDRNKLKKKTRNYQFYRMLMDSCDWEEYLLI